MSEAGAAPRRGRWLAGITLALVAALLAMRSGHWVVGLPVAALALGSGLARRGVAVNRTGQLLLALLALALAWPLYLALRSLNETQTLGTAGTVVALFCLLLALPRLYFIAPLWGPRGHAAITLLALLGCAHMRTGAGYAAFVALVAGAQLLALRATDESRPRLHQLSRRHQVALAVMGVVIVGVSLGLIRSIPPAHYWAMRKAYATFMGMGVKSGFSTEMQLGAVSSIYQSDTVVLRVHGKKPEHLRGFVYDHYEGGGQWTARKRSSMLGVKLLPASHRDDPARTRIDTVGGDRKRYFVPLQARAVSAAEALARVNAMGILRTAPGELAEQVAFVIGPRDRFPVAPATATDRAVPRQLRPRLQALVRRWTAGARGPAGRLLEIQRRLRTDFRYSLSFSRRPGRDPVIDFLTHNRQGHCEYFASAMALLARAAGVPARVVSGYLVQEYNPLAGHHVVRERNAHSWVEAWVAGRWQTFDPTPAGAMAIEREMSTTTALADLLATRLGQAWRWITGLTATHVSVAVALLFVVWVVIRLLRRRRLAHARSQQQALAYGHGLPGLTALLATLARHGSGRAAAEPLESYARRLALEPPPGALGLAAPRLLQSYAAWRYGGEGDPGRLEQQIATLVEGAGTQKTKQ